MVSDQDIAFENSANTEPDKQGDYEKESNDVSFNVSDYYCFSKEYYLKNFLLRLIVWSVYAFWAGAAAFLFSFFSYNYGIVNQNGKSNDLWASALVSVSILCMMHHLQLLVTVR